MKLADLPDLELAALAAMLAELSMAALLLQLAPEVLSAARLATFRAVLARRDETEEAPARIFPSDRRVSLGVLSQFRGLVNGGADALKKHGFPSAAVVLREALKRELEVSTPQPIPMPLLERHVH